MKIRASKFLGIFVSVLAALGDYSLSAQQAAATPTASLPPAPAPGKPVFNEEILRLQIFLDSHLFGPGQLDGRPGELTAKALKRYQRARSLAETELESHTLDLSSVPQVYT